MVSGVTQLVPISSSPDRAEVLVDGVSMGLTAVELTLRCDADTRGAPLRAEPHGAPQAVVDPPADDDAVALRDQVVHDVARVRRVGQQSALVEGREARGAARPGGQSWETNAGSTTSSTIVRSPSTNTRS